MVSVNLYHDHKNYDRIDSSSIIVDLGNIKIINYIAFLLYDRDARSYSYYVDVSLDGKIFVRLFDHSDQYYRSWQYLYFEPRPVRFIKLFGTQVFDVKKQRRAYYSVGQLIDFRSFDVVELKAMHKTANIPKMVGSVIKPLKNVATVQCGANVFEECGGGNNMLSLSLDEYTCHEIGSCILLQFNQAYYVSSLRMLLGNSLNQSNKYSFCIETSVNRVFWKMAVDKRNESLTGWQEFDFEDRPAIFIKITGTQKNIVGFDFISMSIGPYF